MSAHQPAPTAPPPRKRRRWLRRSLKVAGALAVLLGAVVAVLPTAATSAFAERRASAFASEMLGVPVVVEGMEFGWRRTLEVGRVAVGEREGARPLLVVEGVRVPLSLWMLRDGLPLAPGAIGIARVEANAVRDAQGAWNFQPILDAFAQPAGAPAEDKPASAPAPLPLADLKLDIARIDVRLVDETRGLTTGVEGGSLAVLWPGGTSPATVDAAGEIVVNGERLPWDVRAKAEHWIDAERMITADRAVATVSSDGMMGAHQIADGGFFVHAGPPASEPAAVRFVLPMADIARLANAAGLPATASGIDGTVEIAASFSPRADGDADMQASLAAKLAAGGAVAMGERTVRLPAMDLAASADGIADVAAQALRTVDARIEHPGFSLRAQAQDASAAAPIPKAWSFEVQADFGELTRRASEYLGGAPAPMAEGTLAVAGRSTPPQRMPVAGEIEIAFAPSRLATLEPATENPAFLAQGPVDLAPLKTEATIGFEADPQARSATVRLERFSSPLVRDVRFLADAANAGESWSVDAGARASLHPLLAFARQFAADLPLESLAGDLALDAKAAQAPAGAIASTGTLAIEALEARFAEPAWTYSEPRTVATWQIDYDAASARLGIARATLENGMLKADALMRADGANAADGSRSFSLSADADIDKLAALAATLKPLPGVAGGALALRAEGLQHADGKVTATLAASSTRNVTWHQTGLLHFDETIAFESSVEADISTAPVRSMRARIERLDVGDIARFDAPMAVDLAEDGAFAASWSIAANHGPILAVLDEDVLSTRGLALAVEGTTTFAGTAKGRLLAAEGRVDGPVAVEGTLATDIASLEAKFGELTAGLEEIADRHSFRIDVDPADPSTLRATDDATLSIGYLGLPFGAELAGFSAATKTRYGAKDGVEAELAPWSLAEGFVIGERLQLFVPKTTLAGKIAFDPATSRTRLENFVLELEKVGTVKTTSSFAAADGTFATATELSIPDVAAATDLVTYDARGGTAIPKVVGGLRFSADIAGRVPQQPFDPMQPLPATGRAEIEAKGVGIDMADGLRATGVDAVLSFAAAAEGSDISLASAGSIARLVHPAIRHHAPEGIAWDTDAALAGATDLRAAVRSFAVANYGTRAEGSLRVQGLKELLAESAAEPLARALQTLRIDGEGTFEQEFSGLTGIAAGFRGDGSMHATASVRSRPGNRAELSGLVDFADATFEQAGVARVAGLTGTWELGKTLLLSNDAKAPFALPPGRFDVREIVVGAPPLETTVRDMTVTVQGFDDGMRADAIVRDLLGGAATATARLALHDGDPTMTGRFQMTGVDMRLVGGERIDAPDADAEINAVGDLRWRLRATDGDRILEDLGASFATTRIGRVAMVRLLRGLDPEGDSPGIQNALAALRFGKPVGAEGQMNTSLVTFGGQLELPLGLRVDLPIVDRQPISDVVDVYEIRDAGAAAKTLRKLLALLLSRTLSEFENNMDPREDAS